MLDSDLLKYVMEKILPQYENFDAAHSRSHVDTVISQSMQIYNLLNQEDGESFEKLNPNMVYVIASYHDLGLIEGRERHHLVSAEILRDDSSLSKWFSSEQIETMAQAVEDHRASAKNPPRTIYGKIVSEADRVIDSDIIIQRCVQFGLEHYPELSFDEQIERCVTHLCEKYGDGGYMKLQFNNSPNTQRLENLRKIIRNRDLLNHLVSEKLKEIRYLK